MKVIVGLGNPGKDYEKTRHNVGFMVIDEIANKLGISGGKEKFDSLLLEDFVGREKVVLVKPLTFMNDSGRAVRRIMDFYSLDPGDIIVIYDDVDIDLGKLRIRKNGSAGTHNGMRSIIYELKSDDFPRVRLGINKEKRGDLKRFVLKNFSKDEVPLLIDVVKRAADAALAMVDDDIDKVMNQFNIR